MEIIGIRGTLYSGKDTVYSIINQLANGRSEDEIVKDVESGGCFSLGDTEVWENKKYAYKLKQCVALLLGVSVEQLEDRDFKEKPLGEEWRVWWAEYVLSSVSVVPLGAICKSEDDLDGQIDYAVINTGVRRGYMRKETEILTPRRMLQLLGTEGGRKIIHPNIWLNALFADLKEDSKWVITDVRFPNEADAILERGGKVIDLARLQHPTAWAKLFDVDEDFSHLAKTFKCTTKEFAGRIDSSQYTDIVQKLTHESETALDNYSQFTDAIDNSGSVRELVKQVKNII